MTFSFTYEFYVFSKLSIFDSSFFYTCIVRWPDCMRVKEGHFLFSIQLNIRENRKIYPQITLPRYNLF